MNEDTMNSVTNDDAGSGDVTEGVDETIAPSAGDEPSEAQETVDTVEGENSEGGDDDQSM